MDHAGKLAFMLRFYRQAVAAVPHGDHGVLQQGAAGIQDGIQLGMHPVGGDLHLAAYMAQSRAGVVRDLFFRENTAGNFLIDVGQGLQGPEHSVQGIVGNLLVFRVSSVIFRSGGAG